MKNVFVAAALVLALSASAFAGPLKDVKVAAKAVEQTSIQAAKIADAGDKPALRADVAAAKSVYRAVVAAEKAICKPTHTC